MWGTEYLSDPWWSACSGAWNNAASGQLVCSCFCSTLMCIAPFRQNRMAKRPLAIDDGAGEGKQDNMEHHNWYENRQLNVATSPFILGYERWWPKVLGPHVPCANAATGSSTAHTGTDATTTNIQGCQFHLGLVHSRYWSSRNWLTITF